MIPNIGMVHEIPAPLLDSDRFRRTHRAIAKKAVRATLERHHRKTLPGHFKQTNRSKYDHKPRKPWWKEYKKKRYGSITDLVASGETKRSMLSTAPKISVGGTADSFLTGTMSLKFPFQRDNRRGKGAVSVSVMASEIARWTDDEQKAAGAYMQQMYAIMLEEKFRNSPKIRKQIGAKSFMLGS